MFGPQDTIRRRKFLGTLLASASVGAAALSLPHQLRAANERPAPTPDDSDLENWLGKITGKHRQVFDAPDSNSGLPLAWARVFLMTNKAAGVDEKDVSAVVVLRHDAIALGLESRVWQKYRFDKTFKVTNMVTKAVFTTNPFWKPKEGALPLPGMSIDQLQESGVLFGICDMALTVMSQMVGQKMKKDAAEVKKDWVSGIFPGIQIVPSGVLAINRAQEHGCTYCYAG
jgi:intracellular sulfur oxidation DsrE/DsrF family protein